MHYLFFLNFQKKRDILLLPEFFFSSTYLISYSSSIYRSYIKLKVYISCLEVMSHVTWLLLQIVYNAWISFAYFDQVLYYLGVVSQHCTVKRCVALCILYVDKDIWNFSQHLYDVKVANTAGNMQGCLSFLVPGVYLCHFIKQQVHYFQVLQLYGEMEGRQVLVVLEINVCTEVLILFIVEQISNLLYLSCFNCLNEFLISLKLDAPPVLP